MDLRKMMALCLALAVVSGFAVESSAQSLAPLQGWTVRLVRPDSAQYVPIGDSIMVNLVRNTTASSAAAEVFVGIFETADTAAATTAFNANATAVSATLRGALFNGDNASGPAFQPAFDNASPAVADPDKYLGAVATTGTAAGTSITYPFKFKVYAGDGETGTPRDVVVKAFVNIGTVGTPDWKQFSNQSTDIQYATGDPVYDIPVGDRKKFGIDGLRPTNAQIDSAHLFLPRVFTASGGLVTFNAGADTQKSARIGDVVSAKLKVTGAIGVNAGEIIVIPSHADSQNATAYLKYSYSLTDLFAGGVTKSVTLAATTAGTAGSAQQLKRFQNNQRVKAVGFLVDRAGNRSSVNANDQSPIGYSTSIVHVIDTTVPAFTASHPDSTGEYVSGVISTALSMVVPGAPAKDSTVTFPGMPLTATVNEPVRLKVELGGADSLVFTQGTATATNFAVTAVGGASKTFTFTATDSVGNLVTRIVSGVTYDKIAPTLSIFPSRSALGQPAVFDTINAETAHNPVVTYNEILDSLSVRYIQIGSGSNNSHNVIRAGTNLTSPNTDITIGFVAPDTLVAGNQYSLQLLGIDRSGNATVTAPDTLLYNKQFLNPVADSFLVAGSTTTPTNTATADSALVGVNLPIRITAIDSQKTRLAGATRAAVTYKTGGVLVTVTPDLAHLDRLSSIVLSGTGVDTAGYYGMGKALLSASGWTLGTRIVNVKSNFVMGPFTVSASDTTTGASLAGSRSTFVIDETEMSTYSVMAMQGGAAATAVQDTFTVQVVPADQYGNPSTKDSPFLDTRKTQASGVVLGEIFVELSSNRAEVNVPQGPQPVAAGGSSFSGKVLSGNGTGLVITAITSSAAGDTSQISSKQLKANGRTGSLNFAALGEVVVTELDSPDTLIVQDYMGAAGTGDQGGLVLVSFPNTAQHQQLSRYRLYREISVTTDLDDDGNLVIVDPVDKWISWTTVDADPSGGDGVTRAVVPTMDNVPTRWAISAERGASSSGYPAAKRVFTKQSVQQMVQLLGVDPNRVFTPEELSDLFTPPADYVKSIIGDQKNLQFAALDPDLGSLFSARAVPQTIRTDGSEVAVSAKTLSAGPVRAVDNIPPAAVTLAVATEQAGQVILTWTPSVDDRIVASVSYNGFYLPIAGVDHYAIWRGPSQNDLTLYGEAPAGSTTFTIGDPLPGSVYRIDALDLDNATFGPLIVGATSGRITRVGLDGNPVYIMAIGGTTPNRVDFEDFLVFVQSFGRRTGQPNFNPQADTNDDGVVNFQDFLNFANSFNKTAVGPSAKPVIAPPGVNNGVVMSMDLRDDKVLVGQLITVDVRMANAEALQGYGFSVNFDAEKFEFVDAGPAADDLLKSGGGETPLFLKHLDGSKVMVANVQDGSPVKGEGAVVTLTFKVLGDFEDQARFDIADAVVFDGQDRVNPAVVLGALEIQTTPTEFSLLQNFPNPFNPETNIKYNLAEGATVHLRIYNIVGQVVRTLVSERQNAGRYQVRWDGTDDRGATVSSGIYFYQVSAGSFSDVKRLMMLK